MSKYPVCSLVRINDKLLGDRSQGSAAIKWNLCCICQTETDDALQCPSNSKKPNAGAGYKTLGENLKAFEELGALPEWVKIHHLDEGAGIEATLKSHQAKFHSKCRDKFNSTKVQRLRKKHKLCIGTSSAEISSDTKLPKKSAAAQNGHSREIDIHDDVEKDDDYKISGNRNSRKTHKSVPNGRDKVERSQAPAVQKQKFEKSGADPMPIDKYARVVAICNNLALIVSQCDTDQFILRVRLLTHLQLYWTKGCNVKLEPEPGYETDSFNWDDDLVMNIKIEDNSNSILAENENVWNNLCIGSAIAVSPIMAKNKETTKAVSSVAIRNLSDEDKVDLDENSVRDVMNDFGQKSNGNKAVVDDLIDNKDNRLNRASSRIKRKCTLKSTPSRKSVSFARKRKKSNEDDDDGDDNDVNYNDDDSDDNDYQPDIHDDAEKDDDYKISRSDYSSRKFRRTKKSVPTGGDNVEQSEAPAVQTDKSEKSAVECHSEDEKLMCKGKDQYQCPHCEYSCAYKHNIERHIKKHNTVFPCTTCDMTFPRAISLRVHMRTHVDSYKCSYCDKVVSDNKKLRAHLEKHTKKFECTICNKIYTRAPELRNHMYKHEVNAVYPYNCLHCSRGFPLLSMLTSHTNMHTKPFECSTCSHKFASKNLLKMHMTRHESELDYLCPVCEKVFSTKEKLTKHVKGHDNVCNVCGKSFKRRQGLRLHMSNHEDTVLNPITCHVCDESFSSFTLLNVHKKLHVNPHKCEICNEKFATKEELVSHTDQHDVKQHLKCRKCDQICSSWKELKAHRKMHKTFKSELCTICGKSFARGKIKNHIQRHSGVHPYSCQFCGKTFLQKYDKCLHELIHTGEKPFTCNICGKGFLVSTTLMYHKNVHTGERPFSCEVCGEKFGNPTTRCIHMRKHRAKDLFLSEAEKIFK